MIAVNWKLEADDRATDRSHQNAPRVDSRRHRSGDGTGHAGAGAGGPDAAVAGADERHHQRSVRRAGDAPRAGAGAVPVRAAAVRISGTLPRERRDGEAGEGVRLQQRRDRGLSDRADLAAGRRGAVDHGAASREALRHPRHPRVGRLDQRQRRHHRRAGRTSARGRRRTSRARTSRASSCCRLAPSGLGGVYARAVAAGAIGALGISAIGAGDRAVDYPDRDRVDRRQRAAEHGGLGAVAEEGAAARDAARTAGRR